MTCVAPVERGELAATRHVVVVEVRLDDVGDPQVGRPRGVEVDVDVATRIDDGGDARRLVGDERGQVPEPLDPVLRDAHERSLHGRAGRPCRPPVDRSRAEDARLVRSAPMTSHRSLTVIGAGYVGLVSAVGLARLGHTVHLVETGAARLAHAPGRSDPDPRGRPPGGVRRRRRRTAGSRSRTPSGDDPGIILICVGTPDRRRRAQRPEPARQRARRDPRPVRPGRHPGHPEHAPGRRHATGDRGDRAADRARLHQPRVPAPGDARSRTSAGRPGSSSAGSATPTRSRSRRSSGCTTRSRRRAWSSTSRRPRSSRTAPTRSSRSSCRSRTRSPRCARRRAPTSTRCSTGSARTRGSAGPTCSRASGSAGAACRRS